MRFKQATLYSVVLVMCKNKYLYLTLKYFLCFFHSKSLFFHTLSPVSSYFLLIFRATERKTTISLFNIQMLIF